MEYWQYLPVAAVGFLLLAAVTSAVRKHAEQKQRDFTRSLETLLQPRETVKVVCPQKNGRCILTNTRIVFERKGEFSAFPLKKIQRVQGKNKEGNRTAVPGKMVSLTIKMEHDVILQNTGPEFEMLAAQLTEKIKKQNEKKAAREKK